jgi:hypothetical protein
MQNITIQRPHRRSWTLDENGPLKLHFWQEWYDRLLPTVANDNLPEWAKVAA